MDLRRVEESFFKLLMFLSVALAVAALVFIVSVIVWKGGRALSWAMLTQVPKGGYYLGKGGGILNAIVGSLCLGIGATVAASLLALPSAFALQSDYLGKLPIANWVRTALDVLWGIPSIVYGAFGFTIMLALGLQSSLLGGIIALTLVEFPIMVRAVDEVLRMIPDGLKEATYALGATRLEVARRVALLQALPGIVTGMLLALGRGIGDAAAVLFTAGYTDNLPRSLMDPVASLPLAVFFQLGTPFPEVQERAHASALVLLLLVLILSVGCRALSKRLELHVIR